MTDAVIVSTARTPLCKSWRGALNMTHGAKMGGHVVHAALERAKVEPQEVEDVIMGCATPEGATGGNIARQIAIRAGLPVTVSGMTVNRFCSSGLQTVALAAQRILAGEADDLRRRRRRVDLAGAERGQQAPRQGRMAGPAQARDLLADAADRGVRVEEIQHPARGAGPLRRREPAARRQVARRGQVQGRDRADHHQDEGGGQDHRHRDAEGSHRRARRGHPRRHHLRGRVADQAGDRGRRDRGGQRQPVLRRRLGAGR